MKKNKKNYKWDLSRFSGVVIHAKDEATLAKAKKLLKGVPEEKWAETMVSELNNDSVKMVRVERGLFKQGDNAFVDNIVFKQKKEQKLKEGYPFVDVYGKKVKKPRTYKDVRADQSFSSMPAASVRTFHMPLGIHSRSHMLVKTALGNFSSKVLAAFT